MSVVEDLSLETLRTCPSQFPTGCLLPARHFITHLPNEVEVGQVGILQTAADTIHQPLYLRQGYGIFLRKYTPPRREYYGQKRGGRLVYLDEGPGECGGALCRVLYIPGVVMTNQPITLTPLPHKLWWGRDPMEDYHPGPEQEAETVQRTARLSALQLIVQPRPHVKQPLRLSLVMKEERFTYCDTENRQPPPSPLFFPPDPLGPPVIESDSSVSSVSIHCLDSKTLLIRPSAPILCVHSLQDVRRSTSLILGSSATESAYSLRQRRSAQKRGRRRMMPPFVPHILSSPSSSSLSSSSLSSSSLSSSSLSLSFPSLTLDEGHGEVEVTTERVQQDLVMLGDLFPCRADQGLLEEMAFYEDDRNFPLLLTPSHHLSLADFDSLNYLRRLPNSRVLRVNALATMAAQQNKVIEDLKDTDSDLEEECVLEDEVFNPLAYPFNQEQYSEIYLVPKVNKLV